MVRSLIQACIWGGLIAVVLPIHLFATDATRPNVVLIIADDQSYQDFGFLGNKLVHTPNIDRLAERSARYPNSYVPMRVCRPSLATLLTGLYPHQHGIHFNHPPPGLRTMRRMTAAKYRETRSAAEYLVKNVATLPRILSKHGYACLQTGKHWEGSYLTAGFTHGMTLGRPAKRLSPVTGTREQENGEWVAHGNGDAGLVIGRETMQPIQQFLDQRAGKQPFFIWYAPFLPHTPFDAPQKFRDLYDAKKIKNHLLPYYAEIARFDETVGVLIKQLEQAAVIDNTLIVFVSDNGFRPNENRHERAHKRSKLSPFEDGLRTPILISWKGRTEPVDHRELVQTVDIVPTILSAAGLSNEVTDRMNGIDLMPSASGRANLPNRPAFGAVYPNDAETLGKPSKHVAARWIRFGKYKLIVPQSSDSKASRLLFDLEADPLESNNLANSPGHAEMVQELTNRLDAWWSLPDDTKVTRKPGR